MRHFLYLLLCGGILLFSMEKETPKEVLLENYNKKISTIRDLACKQPQYALAELFALLKRYSEDGTSFEPYFIICDILQFLEQQACVQFRSQIKQHWNENKILILLNAKINAQDFEQACKQLRKSQLDEKDETRKAKLAHQLQNVQQQFSYAQQTHNKLQEFDEKFQVEQSQKHMHGASSY